MKGIISEEQLRDLKKEYPVGTRVKLVHMDDPYNKLLKPGCLGTVRCIDSIGTIFVSWDCGSSLGIVYGEDYAVKV